MAIPVVIYYLIFMYWPMYGAQIAFKQLSLIHIWPVAQVQHSCVFERHRAMGKWFTS